MFTLIETIAGFIILVIFINIVGLFYTDPGRLYRYLYIAPAVIAGLFVLSYIIKKVYDFYRSKKDEELYSIIESGEFLKKIDKFIDRLGKQKSKESWNHRDYSFNQSDLAYFLNLLIKEGLKINRRQLEKYLKKRIDDKAKDYLQDSVGSEAKDLNSLSGSDFESLLKRLFEAMGFSVQLTGKSGDQGGDLIANKDGKRHLIQAKRYNGSVSNSAVQEAVAAKPYYDCSHAVVITNGEYTRGAMDLAKANNVQLVGKKELLQKLADHLHEKWI